MAIIKSGANVTFCDDDEITLQPGFTVELGGSFYAYIDPEIGGGLGKLASLSTGGISATNYVTDNENPDEDRAQTFSKSLPIECTLSQNYPNPFNPTTTFKYSLKEDTKVSLKIYNILGQEVRTLVDENQSAGYKTVVWDGKNNWGSQVPGGIYIYRIAAGDFIKSHKLILMK